MQAQGSFKIPQFDVALQQSRAGMGHVSGIPRIATKAVFLSALRAYLLVVAEHVPVLTGVTREQFEELLVTVDSHLEDLSMDYGWHAELSDSDYPAFIGEIQGVDMYEGGTSLAKTARQFPGSPSRPQSPDPGRPYKKPGYYRGQRFESREEWREVMTGNTYGSTEFEYRIVRGGWYQSFDFEIETHEPVRHSASNYYPEVYEALSVGMDAFHDSLAQTYGNMMIVPLSIFVIGGRNA